jgi:hypothetical protein
LAARRVTALLVIAALAGCGGDDDEPAVTEPTPTATATPTPTATATATPTASPAPEEQEGGAGDEEAARVPVRFTVSAEGVDPPQVAIPAFLAIELTVENTTDAPVVVRLDGVEPITVNPGETARAELDGRRPGSYPIAFGDAGQALLVTGAEPGP